MATTKGGNFFETQCIMPEYEILLATDPITRLLQLVGLLV